MLPLIALGIALFTAVQVQAQSLTVSGVVKDEKTGDVLPGVNVLVKGTSKGTITDADGTAWVARNSLVAYGEEVADLCVTPFGQYGKVLVGGKHYAIQPEYSNKLHGCVVRP